MRISLHAGSELFFLNEWTNCKQQWNKNVNPIIFNIVKYVTHKQMVIKAHIYLSFSVPKIDARYSAMFSVLLQY